MEAVTLKNGTEELDALVRATMSSLEGLLNKNPIAFYELVMKCRDQNYQPFGNTGQTLHDFALLGPDGNVHVGIRNVVLSAVVGDDLEMTLGSPIQGH